MNSPAQLSRRASLIFFFLTLAGTIAIFLWIFVFKKPAPVPAQPQQETFTPFLEKMTGEPVIVKPVSAGFLHPALVTKGGKSVLMNSVNEKNAEAKSIAFFDRPLVNAHITFPPSEKYMLISSTKDATELYYLLDIENAYTVKSRKRLSANPPLENVRWLGEWLTASQDGGPVVINPATLAVKKISVLNGNPSLLAEKAPGIFIFIGRQQAGQIPGQAGASLDEVLGKISESGSFEPDAVSDKRFLLEIDALTGESRTLTEVTRDGNEEAEEIRVDAGSAQDAASAKIYLKKGGAWFVLKNL